VRLAQTRERSGRARARHAFCPQTGRPDPADGGAPMPYPKKHRGRRKLGSKKRQMRNKAHRHQ